MKLPLSTTLHHSNPENRFPFPKGRTPSSRQPIHQKMIAEKNDPLLGPASDQMKWKRSLNTGSRKHCVSKSHFALSPARHSRGQVYRDFINSLLSVANPLPTLLASKLLILGGQPASAAPAAGRFAPDGVAW
jgi:hypothetical protein